MILDKNAPTKKKIVKNRGNEAPFLTKELSKAIMNKFNSKFKFKSYLNLRVNIQNGRLGKNSWHLTL